MEPDPRWSTLAEQMRNGFRHLLALNQDHYACDVSRSWFRWRAACPCGWRGKERWRLGDQARGEWAQHYRDEANKLGIT